MEWRQVPTQTFARNQRQPVAKLERLTAPSEEPVPLTVCGIAWQLAWSVLASRIIHMPTHTVKDLIDYIASNIVDISRHVTGT